MVSCFHALAGDAAVSCAVGSCLDMNRVVPVEPADLGLLCLASVAGMVFASHLAMSAGWVCDTLTVVAFGLKRRRIHCKMLPMDLGCSGKHDLSCHKNTGLITGICYWRCSCYFHKCGQACLRI